MNPIYAENHYIESLDVDCFGRLKISSLLYLAQEVAGRHGTRLGVGYDVLMEKRMIWVVTRHRIQITRLPRHGETIRIETWPMPNTRVAYPRSMVAYDENGEECYRLISLWVLMDVDKRSLILPDKSGITVESCLRGTELESPMGLGTRDFTLHTTRPVCFTDLDRNRHMNNTRYLDWASDLMSTQFHETFSPREIVVCYFSEALEGQLLNLSWGFPHEGVLQVQGLRSPTDNPDRVFSIRYFF